MNMPFKIGDIVRKNLPNGYEMRVTSVNRSSITGEVTKAGVYDTGERRWRVGDSGGAIPSTFTLVSSGENMTSKERAIRIRADCAALKRDGFDFDIIGNKLRITRTISTVEEI